MAVNACRRHTDTGTLRLLPRPPRPVFERVTRTQRYRQGRTPGGPLIGDFAGL